MAGDEGINGRVVRSKDAALINSIMKHPKIYPFIADDGSPKREDFDASYLASNESVYFLVVYDGEEVLGLFMVHAHNSVMFEAHTCLLPNAWGSRAVKSGRLAQEWMFQNSPCRKLITVVPRINRLALAFAKRCGWKIEGVLKKSYLKNGVLHDLYLLGQEKQ